MKRQKAKYVLLKHLIYLEEESVTIFFHLAFSNLDHIKNVIFRKFQFKVYAKIIFYKRLLDKS